MSGVGAAPRPLAKDGKPGCPVTVWDGPYSMRCGLGASVGTCAYHGAFASAAPAEHRTFHCDRCRQPAMNIDADGLCRSCRVIPPADGRDA